MQTASVKNWRPTKLISGNFGGYEVWGLRYEETRTREIAWQITVNPGDHTYWVSGEEFYAVSIDLFHNFTNTTLIEVHGMIPGLDSRERKAVLAAINEWEHPKERGEDQPELS